MKILELTNYSAGICGVWQRVQQEAKLLSQRGHEVEVFSSNCVKGSNKIASESDSLERIKIKRFPALNLGGESFLKWDFEKEFVRFNPDVIIAHGYRHIHTSKALFLAEKYHKRVILVTHAPFVENDFTRSFLSKIAVKIYDSFVGPRLINRFDKIVHITQWEVKYLEELGVEKNKLIYIPNGVPEEFFKKRKKVLNLNNIIFLGRISPVKNLELLILTASKFRKKNSSAKVYIVGPAEEDYLNNLKRLISENNLSDSVLFLDPVYDLDKKIELLNNHGIFVLPSRRDAMPQSLIEAFSLGMICVSSNTQGGKEIISDGKDGFLFELETADDLQLVLSRIYSMKKNVLSRISSNAVKRANDFRWTNLIKNLEKVL